jgi:hypothetical protein
LVELTAELLVLLLLFFAGALVLFCAGLETGLAATGAVCAANIRGMEATAKAIVANNLVFIFSLPGGPIARLQIHIAPDRRITR